jgi:hypothetical protein
MISNKLNVLVILVAMFLASACEYVEDGYRIDYQESTAIFTVQAMTPDRGAIGDTVKFSLKVEASENIQSLVVNPSVSGADGTGYVVDANNEDPLIDHSFGTIQPGIKKIDLWYNYIFAVDTINPTIHFIMVDGEGKKELKINLIAVPPIVRYQGVTMFSQTSSKTDGFSSVDGKVYADLTHFEEVDPANQAIQESVDIVLLIKNDTAMLVAPYNNNLISNMAIKNKTLFQRIDGMDDTDFQKLTSSTLSSVTQANKVGKGSTYILNIKVGDFIGFRTDFASSNPYHYGIIRVNALHPSSTDHYEGKCFLIEMDIVTQK